MDATTKCTDLDRNETIRTLAVSGGLSLRQIGDRVGLSHMAVKRRLLAAGVTWCKTCKQWHGCDRRAG